MIALIPGLTAALASLQPQAAASQASQEGFSQVLNDVSKSAAGKTREPAAPSRYEVQSGDNLTAIAKKLGYDDPNALARANNLKDPDRLAVGQVLALPDNQLGGKAQVSNPQVAATGAKRAIATSKVVAAAVQRPRVQSPAASAVSVARGRGQLVSASWYGSQHQGRLMANGQPFNMYADTVAHKSLPLGTKLTITNPQNGNSVKVQVTDRGPYIAGRSLDLSYSAARKLGVVENGVAKVVMEGG
jgi:rare lipoprotein A